MSKVTMDSLDALFDHFELQNNAVLWLTSLDNQRQLYISKRFEEIWGVKTQKLYENASSWGEYVHENDKDRVLSQVKNRALTPDKTIKESLLYRILDNHKKIRYLHSSPFLLTSNEDIHIAFGGITQELEEGQWITALDKYHNGHMSEMKHHVFNTLNNEIKVLMAITNKNFDSRQLPISQDKTIFKNGKAIHLTEREAQCLHYLSQGKSAKETSTMLHISQRTVEFHLNNVKEKAGCRSKLELLTKLKFICKC